MDLLQEKLAAEFPLTDENLALFDAYFKPLEEFIELRPTDPNITIRISRDDQSEEYWDNQRVLMIRTMEEQKARNGHF